MVETKLKLLDLTEPGHELQLYYIRGTRQVFKLSFFLKGKSFLIRKPILAKIGKSIC